MRLPRPRLRLHLRTLLIAVAVAGLALVGWQMWRRREYCLSRAAHWDDVAETSFEMAKMSASMANEIANRPQGDGDEERRQFELKRLKYREVGERRVAEYGRLWAARYRRIARRPWLPLPPEPPRHIAAPPPPE